MEPHYSLTTWIIRPGNEDEFLRDVDDSSRFISFGPWETLEAIRRWRTLEGFQSHVAALSEVVEDFEPRTLELVTEH